MGPDAVVRLRLVRAAENRPTLYDPVDRQAGTPGPAVAHAGSAPGRTLATVRSASLGQPSRQKLDLDPGLETRTVRVPRRRKCLQTTFESLGLGAELVHGLAEQGYTEPTALQGKAIQSVLAGRNLLALAGDGAGRTLAYGLPVLQRLRDTAAP